MPQAPGPSLVLVSVAHSRAGEGAGRSRAGYEHGRSDASRDRQRLERQHAFCGCQHHHVRRRDGHDAHRHRGGRQASGVVIDERTGRGSAQANRRSRHSTGAAVARGSGAAARARTADVSDRERVRREHRGSRSRSACVGCAAHDHRCDDGRQAGGSDLYRGLSRSERARDGGRDEQWSLCVSPLDRHRLFGDGADARRYRQRVGAGRRARLECDRRGVDWPDCRAEGCCQPQSADDRARPLHGGARAAGRQRSDPAARQCAGRAQCRRRAQSVLETRRREPDRREGDRRARHALLRSDWTGPCWLRPSTCRACRSAAWCGSRRAS